MKPSKGEVELHRKKWAKVAKANGWYKEPFKIQVWHDKKGHIVDSVSFIGLDKDIFEVV